MKAFSESVTDFALCMIELIAGILLLNEDVNHSKIRECVKV